MSVPDFAAARLESVSKEFDLGRADLVVTITWNTDGTDIDLHVKEPTGEECYYEHTKTKIGGRITEDVTQGYGPEMYTLARAVPGKYRIRVKYYSAAATRAGTRTKVYAIVYQRWGTPNEKVTRKVRVCEYEPVTETIRVPVCVPACYTGCDTGCGRVGLFGRHRGCY